MCVCVCVCANKFIHTHTQKHTSMLMHARTRTHTHPLSLIYTHTFTHGKEQSTPWGRVLESSQVSRLAQRLSQHLQPTIRHIQNASDTWHTTFLEFLALLCNLSLHANLPPTIQHLKKKVIQHTHKARAMYDIQDPCNTYTGWLWLVGSLKFQVSIAEYCLEYCLLYRACLQKRSVILRRPLIVRTA